MARDRGRAADADRDLEEGYLHGSKVGDGVCDCCDGADEWIAQQQQMQQVPTRLVGSAE